MFYSTVYCDKYRRSNLYDTENDYRNPTTAEVITVLTKMIKNIVGFTGNLFWDITKPDGTYKKQLDVSKLNTLGWKEKISLEEGIKTVYDNYVSEV